MAENNKAGDNSDKIKRSLTMLKKCNNKGQVKCLNQMSLFSNHHMIKKIIKQIVISF